MRTVLSKKTISSRLVFLFPILAALLAVVAVEDRALGYQWYIFREGSPCRWNLSALPDGTIHWTAAADAPPELREAMLAVSQSWTAATGGKIKFTEGGSGILLEWDASGVKIPDPLFLAVTSFNTDASLQIASARIVVNANNYTWRRDGPENVGPAVNGKRSAHLDSVLLHELGHALGLDHSDLNATAIVGNTANGDLPTMNSVIHPTAGSLHLDDETGAQLLYEGVAAESSPLTIAPSVTVGRAPLTVEFTQTGGGEDTVWDFGDGTILSGSSISHKFVAVGTYTVTAFSNGKSASVEIKAEKKGKRVKKQKPAKKAK